MLGDVKLAFVPLEPDAAGRCFPDVERRDIIVLEGEGVQDDHLHKDHRRVRRRWWLLENKAGEDCSIVGPQSSAPAGYWERVWAPRLRGSQTAVVTRRLNRPRSKEVAQVPGCWQETAEAQAGRGNRCEVKGIVCTYVIKSGAHTHTQSKQVVRGWTRLRPLTTPN